MKIRKALKHFEKLFDPKAVKIRKTFLLLLIRNWLEFEKFSTNLLQTILKSMGFRKLIGLKRIELTLIGSVCKCIAKAMIAWISELWAQS